jgi:hypothetical protein
VQVYVLSNGWDYEGEAVVGVFSTLDLAKAARSTEGGSWTQDSATTWKQHGNRGGVDYRSIEKHDVQEV